MSEATTEAVVVATETTEPQGDPVDKPLGENGEKALRAERDRAKELEKQLNAATTKLTELERANETVIEKAMREAQEAKVQIEQVPQKVADQLRDHLVKIHGISEEHRDLYLTSNDPETLLKQAAGLVERTPQGTPKPDLTQGGSSTPAALNSDALTEALRSKLGIS